jgi:hypothetical protein
MTQISSNLANIQNVLYNGLQQDHPDLKDSIYCACHLNSFSRFIGQGILPLINQIQHLFPQPRDYQLEVCVTIEMLASYWYSVDFDAEKLIPKTLELFELFDDTNMKCMVYSMSVIMTHKFIRQILQKRRKLLSDSQE